MGLSESTRINGIFNIRDLGITHSTTIEIASEIGIRFTNLPIAGWLMVFSVPQLGKILPLIAF
jgi:hypothetical protein